MKQKGHVYIGESDLRLYAELLEGSYIFIKTQD